MTLPNKYYHNKALGYGISSTRMNNILKLLDGVTGKNILDAGCATGYVGENLKNKGNYVVGLDVSPEAIKRAKNKLDEAFVFDLESGLDFPLKRNFDLIIMSEVIEHLFLPKETIKFLKKRMKKNGQILISTPNFLHIANRKRFLFGDFNYDSTGVFDEGHIRFFTYKSMVMMMKNLGFSLVNEKHVFSPNYISFFPGLFAYQFIFLFEKN
ncbi:MAG: class I SAM-dependent methyltransferase [bacterium]|nr:class I SAM-dependent methyltransferase [bacterium]